jgi:cytochrome c553
MNFIQKIKLSVLATAMLTVATAHADPQIQRAEEIVSGRCFICHGMEGEAASPVFPRLAGQHAEYVAKQLADFRSGKRKSDAMASQVEELNEADMKALGKFFEGKVAGTTAISDKDLLAVGRYIYARGNEFSGIPSCASCHGKNAHGAPLLPRLAGQHPQYVEAQLKQFTQRVRNNDNAVMHMVASRLTPLETHAVAAYVATLE